MAYTKTIWNNNTAPKINSTNLNHIEDGIESIDISLSNMRGKVLWTNPNPTDTFSAQSITLLEYDYDILEVYYISSNGTNDDFMSSTKAPKGNNISLVSLGYQASTSPSRVRRINYVSETELSVTDGKSGTVNTSNTNNSICIPIYIVGYKTSLFESEE